MNIGEIIKDSLRYPFSDWKKILIFGILVLISNIHEIHTIVTLSNIGAILYLLSILGFVFLLGYIFWNIKSSLDEVAEHQESNNWIQIFIDGIKVLVVFIVYIIPVFLFLFVGRGLPVMTVVSLSLLYPLIIAPIFAIAISHMANNDSKFGFAFRFFEIVEKIESIGWIKLIMWYIITGIIFIIIKVIGIIISGFISYIIGIVIALILSSIFYIYLSRSIALVYKSGHKNH